MEEHNWQEEWAALQEKWRSQLTFETPQELEKLLQDSSQSLNLKIGGVDLSFVDNDKSACAAYVVMTCRSNDGTSKKKCKFSPDSSFQVIYEDLRMVELVGPYVPGFLAFREAGPIIDMVKHQQQTKPEVTPDVLIVDGNGLLHPRKFGLACHVGLKLDLPTIGVAKNLYYLQSNDETTAENRRRHREESREKLRIRGDHFDIYGPDQPDNPLGIALKTARDAENPVYVSSGHKISLERCKDVVLRCSSFRIPEPTRQADIRSREFIRKL
jgi:deoxyinosine 3'endonuclease (endonuclease V)